MATTLPETLPAQEGADIVMQDQQAPQAVDPGTFAADVHNAVMDYCADGVDAFEQCLLSQAHELDPQVMNALRQGMQSLYEGLVTRVGASMELFEQVCCSSVFKTPDVALPKIPTASEPAPLLGGQSSEAVEAELQQSITQLRERLAQVDAACCAARSDVQLLDQELSQGDLSGFAALAASASDSKDALQAIMVMAGRLQPLLDKAQVLRAAGGGNGPRGMALEAAGGGAAGAAQQRAPLEAVRAFERALAA